MQPPLPNLSAVTTSLAIPLNCSPEQTQRLAQLQQVFAQACNVVAEVAQANRCWNRVALHHLAYRRVREQFADLGSQMACNAVYSVCKACRWLYQHPASPFTRRAAQGGPLPRVVFLPIAPVYFDRHTLNITAGQLSMFTLDGRLKFQIDLSEAQELRFRSAKLKETALTRGPRGYQLVFWFESEAPEAPVGPYQSMPEFLKPEPIEA